MQTQPLKNKKIICTVTNDLYRDGRMIRICSALTGYGADVCLTGFKTGKSLPLTQQKFDQKRFNLIFTKGVLFYLEYNLRLFIFLLTHNFDIVNSVDTDTVLAGYLASKIKRKKVVFDAHEFFTGLPELENKRIKSKIWTILEKYILRRIKNNYTVSESLKELYENKTGQKYAVIKNLPPKSRYILKPDFPSPVNIDKNKELIVYAGVLNSGRGLESSIKMMKYFDDNKHLLIIGNGYLEKKLKNLVIELELQEKVSFTGWVDFDIIPYLIKDAVIGLNLLDGNFTNYKVSLANKVFDYIHLGIPCLTMDFVEYRKLQNNCNCLLLTDTLNPEKNYKIINSFLEDKTKQDNTKLNAIKASENLVWDKEKEKLLTIYQ